MPETITERLGNRARQVAAEVMATIERSEAPHRRTYLAHFKKQLDMELARLNKALRIRQRRSGKETRNWWETE